MPDLVLLHFDPPYEHARHYLLYAKGIGRGRSYARDVITGRTFAPNALVESALVAGCRIEIARVIPGGDRNERRRMRRNGSLSRFCPTCRSAGIHHP